VSFKDHFSVGSADYAAYRPTYPPALVDYLASLCAETSLALDVGCGTGQLSVLLARRFSRVIATDASAQQIDKAEAQKGVEYRVAQAAHWFDLPAFYAEARRIGKPGAVLALVTYGVVQADPAVDPLIQDFYWNVVGPYWPPERRHVEEGYRSFAFPFDEVTAPPLAIEVSWDAAGFLGYAGTWSASREAEKVLGREPMERFRRDLLEAWGEPGRRRTIRFPLSLRVGRM
jgi:SAM-dependent methyltransferase